jgi:hypothetical protein
MQIPPPYMFEMRSMWKRTSPNPCTPIKHGDLGILMATRMNEIGMGTWELTLQRPKGKSPFTGKHDWADGSPCVSEPFTE